MRIRDEKKIDAVVNASIQLVNKLGFSGISITKIAKEANVSPATIYIYYKNKEDLFTQIYIDIRKKIDNEVLKVVDEKNPVEEQFQSLWYNYTKFALEHHDLLLYRERFEQTQMQASIDQSDFEVFNYTTNLIKKGIKEHKIRNLPLPFLFSFAFMPLITLIKFNFEGKLNIDDALINQASRLAWNAIKI